MIDIELPDDFDQQHGIDSDFDEWPDDIQVVLGVRIRHEDARPD